MTGLQQKSQRACSAFGITHKGRVRAGNEDAFLCNVEEGVFVVCDGMGGAAAGEVASHLAAESASEVLVHGEPTEGLMREAVAAANAKVYSRANTDRRLEGMGTTLVMLSIGESDVFIAHVGDSRCYLWRDGELSRLTADHSLVEEQVRLGQLTRRQAERSALQHVITRAIGTTADVVPDVNKIEIQAGDVFMLASDGLTKELSEPDIAVLLSRQLSEQQSAEALLALANAAGGRDNITCILIRIL
jgi:serine/threonine protein phosphatase PrpC